MRRLMFVVAVLAACGGNGPGDDGGGGGGGGSPDAAAGGTGTPLTVNWSIRWSSGSTTTCGQVMADEVWLTATPEDTSKPDINKTFQCVLLPGTVNLPAGRYAVSAKLHSSTYGLADGAAQAVTMPTNQAITFNFAY